VGIYVYLLIVVIITLKEKGVMQMTRLYTFTKVSQLDVRTSLLHHSVTNLLHTYRQAQKQTSGDRSGLTWYYRVIILSLVTRV